MIKLHKTKRMSIVSLVVTLESGLGLGCLGLGCKYLDSDNWDSDLDSDQGDSTTAYTLVWTEMILHVFMIEPDQLKSLNSKNRYTPISKFLK